MANNWQSNHEQLLTENEMHTAVVAGCKQLIQNAIVLWNYLYLNQKLTKMDDLVGISEFLETVRNSSIISWQHINMQGEYDFLSNRGPAKICEKEKVNLIYRASGAENFEISL